MFKKPLVLALFILSRFLLFGQDVEVSLTIKDLSPCIKSFAREQLEKILLDTAVSLSNREFKKFSNDFTFHKTGNTQQRSQPDYKFDIKVTDSVLTDEKYARVHVVMVYSRIYESNPLPDSIVDWMETSGVAYSFDSSATMESEVINKYLAWLEVHTLDVLRSYLPLSLKNVKPSKNIADDMLPFLDYYKDIIIIIDEFKPNLLYADDQRKIRIIIQNLFLINQDFYYRATRKKRACFNYYFASDSIPPRVTLDNPMKIRFIISNDSAGYTLQIKIEGDSAKVGVSEAKVSITNEMLSNRPTLVNNRIASSIASFIYRNL